VRPNAVVFKPQRLRILEDDVSLAFVLEAVTDLTLGLRNIISVFEDEMNHIVEKVHLELRSLFGTYMGMVLVLYILLFKKTINGSRSETNLVRQFIVMLPSHVLERPEVDLIKRHFSPAESLGVDND